MMTLVAHPSLLIGTSLVIVFFLRVGKVEVYCVFFLFFFFVVVVKCYFLLVVYE